MDKLSIGCRGRGAPTGGREWSPVSSSRRRQWSGHPLAHNAGIIGKVPRIPTSVCVSLARCGKRKAGSIRSLSGCHWFSVSARHMPLAKSAASVHKCAERESPGVGARTNRGPERPLRPPVHSIGWIGAEGLAQLAPSSFLRRRSRLPSPTRASPSASRRWAVAMSSSSCTCSRRTRTRCSCRYQTSR
jgi:hypothetical protein